MNTRPEEDFGFSLVDEDELKAYEKELEQRLELIDVTASEYRNRLIQLRDIILPLLVGLTEDPTKKFVLWPSRAAKVQILITKINEIMDGVE